MEQAALERQKRLRYIFGDVKPLSELSTEQEKPTDEVTYDQDEQQEDEHHHENEEQIPIEALAPNNNKNLKEKYEILYAPLKEKTQEALQELLIEKTKQ